MMHSKLLNLFFLNKSIMHLMDFSFVYEDLQIEQ